MPEPRQELINAIETQMDLFQTTVGKASANITSALTIILNEMGHTILSQYDEIQSLRATNEKLKKSTEKDHESPREAPKEPKEPKSD